MESGNISSILFILLAAAAIVISYHAYGLFEYNTQFRQYQEARASPGNFDVLKRGSLSANLPQSDEEYLDSYTDVTIHQDMLRDRSRTLAYRNSIFENKHLFEGKVVMDVGAGTGILSMFAAQAGARRVLAIEASSASTLTARIIRHNEEAGKIKKGVIEVIHGTADEIELDEKVDIIISEWMGYYLLFEGFVHGLLDARDAHLKEGGLMFPQEVNIYLAGASFDRWHHFNDGWWNDVYGVDLSLITDQIKFRSDHPVTENIDPEDLLTDVAKTFHADMRTITREEVDSWTAQANVKARRDGTIDVVAMWFDCIFPGPKVEILDTSPFSTPTHWHQGLIVLDKPLQVERGSSLKLVMGMEYALHDWHCLNIRVRLSSGQRSSTYAMQCVSFQMPYHRLSSFWTDTWRTQIDRMEDSYVFRQTQKYAGAIYKYLGFDLASHYTFPVYES